MTNTFAPGRNWTYRRPPAFRWVNRIYDLPAPAPTEVIRDVMRAGMIVPFAR